MNETSSIRCSLGLLAITLITMCGGCASLTNPVANGIPAHLLPDELLASSVERLEPTPLDWLKVTPPDPYRLDTGDILGIYVEGALGDRDQVLPINFPQVGNAPPSTGFPVPIGEDGAVSLPFVKTVKVKGMTVEEAQTAIESAYVENQILKAEKLRALVTLVRARTARIHVIREDAPGSRAYNDDASYRLFGSAPSLGQRSKGTGMELELAETEADVLSALALTGGLPGPTAANEVVIYRGADVKSDGTLPADWKQRAVATPRITRIPLRIEPGSARNFTEDDIRLRAGDIVFIPPRETDVYYTGGLLPAREVPLPRDNDLRVVEAMLRVGGSVLNGGSIIGNFNQSGAFLSSIQNSNPSLLTVIRRTPNNQQVVIRVDLNRALRDPRENLLVHPGDMLVLQETPSEAVSRYFANVFDFGIFSQVWRRGSAAGQASLSLP